ncbi:type IV pilus modification protein PilV [Halomonas rhizosphaerae]|uniref:Type IV pilus modification protein PilV n=1 Tax=Halomonas rhizosphaerae TaxID=3043296 RepID=A0ABT6UWU2_9GAMM|nr:type IV pilus modification protein PilV [Halomonas rhizosphaerae]MDI5890438.1 type IV pilus modification protein PilV [Halomonas rhizosphaerae]
MDRDCLKEYIGDGRQNRQKGFTLLEVLIAVLVLSVGLLGVAALQMKSMQSAHLSYQRSIANLAAQDAVERLWVALGSASNECPDPDDASYPVEDAWRSHWSGKLPGMSSVSTITRGSTVRCEYTILVAWDDDRFVGIDGSGEAVSSLTYVIQLPGREPEP